MSLNFCLNSFSGYAVVGGHNLLPLVEIGLTDLPKSGCAKAHPAHPGTTGLIGRGPEAP